MAHEGYHEPYENLTEPVRAMHRALASLIEELEAVDWYYQRAAVTEDAELRAILLHNAHEEIEHASMALEWVRRHDETFDTNLQKYLFKPGSIVGAEAATKATAPQERARPDAPARRPVRATIGSMRREGGGER